jgi:hypothetical protein
MIQNGADVLPWYILVLMFSHDTDWCWYSPIIHISADVQSVSWENISTNLCHERQSVPICIMGEHQHQSVSWETISTSLFNVRASACIMITDESWCSPMIQTDVDFLPWCRLVLMFSHDTDWCWWSPMLQTGADCFPWNRLALMFYHDTGWCSHIKQTGTDCLPWYRLVLMFSHDTDWCWCSPMIKTGADCLPWNLCHERQSVPICITGEHQHQSVSWDTISTSLFNVRASACIMVEHQRQSVPWETISTNLDVPPWYRLVLIVSRDTD